MSDFPKKLEVVLSTSDQIVAWGLAIAFVAALYLVAFVIGYGLTGLLFPKPAPPSPPAPPQSRPSLRDRSYLTPPEHSITESPVRATFRDTAGQRPMPAGPAPAATRGDERLVQRAKDWLSRARVWNKDYFEGAQIIEQFVWGEEFK
jgi:hypothetical protein